MTGIALERRIQHSRYFGPRLEPARDLLRALLLVAHTVAYRAISSQRKKTFIATQPLTVIGDRPANREPALLDRRDDAHHHVRTAAAVFRRGVYRDVYTALERRKEERRTPRIVGE